MPKIDATVPKTRVTVATDVAIAASRDADVAKARNARVVDASGIRTVTCECRGADSDLTIVIVSNASDGSVVSTATIDPTARSTPEQKMTALASVLLKGQEIRSRDVSAPAVPDAARGRTSQ